MTSRILDLRGKKPQKNEHAEQNLPATHSHENIPDHVKIIRWEALEFPNTKRDQQQWLLAMTLIAIPLVVLFLFFKNILGAILVILGATTLLLEAFRKPRLMSYVVDEKGVLINDKQHLYEELAAFAYLSEPKDRKEFSLRTKKSFGQRLSLVLGSTEAEIVRAALKPYLPEEERQLSPFELWWRKQGF